MKNKEKFKVGDNIVELGQVFRIFKIKRVKNGDGELEKVLFFRPYYQTKNIASIVCSIPIKNVELTSIRQPMTEQEFREYTKKLKKRIKLDIFPAINTIKVLLKSNDPDDTVMVLKVLYNEKKKKPENFSKSKKDIFNLAMEYLVEEFALVGGVSLDKARERINLALQG